ncbi:MAG: TRAP transporter substrate-binding protein DctP [Rhodospirillales bacterium]|jgi:tripartite ATP-independent transporter DctP family solute receptor|nr:TRAP transporter substrate-binding protein DctP [Rhodospirillales bacterium]
MHSLINRRVAMTCAAALLVVMAMPTAHAQQKIKLKFSSVAVEQDFRTQAMKMFADEVKDEFDVEIYPGATLFKQGTELVAIQRGNLEMGIITPQDVSKQIPSWSILTAAYLFKDIDHVKRVLASDIGKDMYALAEEKAGIHILGPMYFGSRQVNLKPKKKISTPADMAGIKLRMPNGEAWQLLGRSLGANPTPMAFAETYTGLQTGAIDGQDNPLPNDKVMKFYEVTSQIVLTSHLIAFDHLSIGTKVWKTLTPAQQAKIQAAADKAIDWSTKKHLDQEKELVEFFKAQGLDVYTPDLDAFRKYAQKMYLESEFAKDWPAGIVARINAM